LPSKESCWQGYPFITDKTERNVCNSQQTIYHQILILKDVNFHMFLAENLENKLHSRKPRDWKLPHVSCRKLRTNYLPQNLWAGNHIFRAKKIQ